MDCCWCRQQSAFAGEGIHECYICIYMATPPLRTTSTEGKLKLSESGWGQWREEGNSLPHHTRLFGLIQIFSATPKSNGSNCVRSRWRLWQWCDVPRGWMNEWAQKKGILLWKLKRFLIDFFALSTALITSHRRFVYWVLPAQAWRIRMLDER